VDIPEPLLRRAAAAARVLRDAAATGATVTVVHHIDADGVCSGAIACEALARAGIPYRPHAVRSLDDHHVREVLDGAPDAVWLCDLGSVAHGRFAMPKVVCDHHELVRDGHEDFAGHVSPLLDDLPGDGISGAGCAFLVALALDDRNADLLPIALVGATGDLQDRKDGRFHGANAAFVATGVARGLLAATTDLAFYGPETRPLASYLAYTDDRPVPGLTKDRRGAEAFLRAVGITRADATWGTLAESERVALRSAIVNRRLDCGLGTGDLWRQVVRVVREPRGEPTRELQEFATLLNSTARYDRPDVGLAVARGDRAAAYAEARDLRQAHSKHLMAGLDQLLSRLEEHASCFVAHAGDSVRDTLIGILCGMAVDRLGAAKPLIGTAHSAADRTKVSSRLPASLRGRVDLSGVMRTAAAAVGGEGGGHAGAAGATIPRGTEAAFITAVADALAGRVHAAATQS
jgi:RecJ-like exonuclease